MDTNTPSGSMGYLRMSDELANRAGNLNIGNLEIGVSRDGAYEYLEGIKTNAIDKAIEALKSTGHLFQVLQGGWQGQSEASFENNLIQASEIVIEQLELIKKNIEHLVASMLEDIAEQDKSMIEEFSIK